MGRRIRTGMKPMARRPRHGLPDAAARGEAGASAVEFAIAAPALLLALLGSFQAALLYQARAQLEVATQEAVRAGTLHGASVEAMRNALARGLTPLYTHGQNLSALAQGYATAKVAAGQATIRVLSPTREAFDDFAEQTRDTSGAWIKAIPVDHLGYRQTGVGSGSHLSVQDATLLKVQITAVQPLIVPFIDQIGRGIYQMDKGLGNVGLPSLFGVRLSPMTGVDGKTRWGIPMQAEAVMRMQSPVLAEGLPSKASLGQGQNTDPGNDEGEDFNEVIPIYDENPDQPGSPADTPPPGACTGGSPFDN